MSKRNQVDIYVRLYKERLRRKVLNNFHELEKMRDDEDYRNFDDPSYHEGWYNGRIESYRIILDTIKESK